MIRSFWRLIAAIAGRASCPKCGRPGTLCESSDQMGRVRHYWRCAYCLGRAATGWEPTPDEAYAAPMREMESRP